MKKIVTVLLVAVLSVVCMTTAFADNLGRENLARSPGSINAKSAIVIDQSTGKAIWRKDSKVRMNPASTTKIMTALLAIEYDNMKDTVTIGPEVDFPASDASVAGLVQGERISLENLLKGMMLPSGADAAYAIAVYTARKASKNPDLDEREAVNYFSDLMNKRAVKAGARSTHFVNPDGYHAKNHYSTASDLSLIARAAMKYKQFGNIVALQSFQTKAPQNTSDSGKSTSVLRTWKNTNKLMNKNSSYFYKYATGIKTGYTSEAGHCLVSSASRDGKNVISVVLDSTNGGVWNDSIKLLDYGLEAK